MGNLDSLSYLRVAVNELTGKIGILLTYYHYIFVYILHFIMCFYCFLIFSGIIPDTLVSLTNLVHLSLLSNCLSGTVLVVLHRYVCNKVSITTNVIYYIYCNILFCRHYTFFSRVDESHFHQYWCQQPNRYRIYYCSV